MTDRTDRDALIDAVQFIADTFTTLDRIECTLILDKIEPLIRVNEREKIAQAIEADRDALTRRINDSSDPYWSAEQANDWAIERVALNRAARIARRGDALRAGNADE